MAREKIHLDARALGRYAWLSEDCDDRGSGHTACDVAHLCSCPCHDVAEVRKRV